MIDRLTDAIIADWPVYLLGAVVLALCMLAIWLGWRVIKDALDDIQNKEIEAEALRRENLAAQRAANTPIDFND
jgi:membrane protein implicated in regulation of membrane protease activity